jgi:RNA polymerase subunit RPABC4/transcription elongation factor Spt4
MCGGHFTQTLTPFLATLAQTTNQPPSLVVATQRKNCPTCGSAVSPEFAWCPNCGAALKDHPCAYCGQIVSPGDKTCNFCGAPARFV